MSNKVLGELVPLGGGDIQLLTSPSVVIGRSSSNGIVLPFSNVSSRHCKLVLSEGYWYVQDLNSTNGVRVNGKKVTDRRVDPGDTLTISKHQFVLKYIPAQLGATGIPPREVLNDETVFQSSLLQKAGLAAKTLPPDAASQDEEIAELIESAADNAPTATDTNKRNYFDDLKF